MQTKKVYVVLHRIKNKTTYKYKKYRNIHRLSISLYKCSMDIKEPNKYFCRNIIGKLANSMKIDLPWIKI